MKPLIKWPGGKSGEINQIEKMIPDFERYIEPFFGGGAVFFHLKPQKALINDISPSLIEFYTCVKNQSPQMRHYLLSYHESFQNVLSVCKKQYDLLYHLYCRYIEESYQKETLETDVRQLVNILSPQLDHPTLRELVLDFNEFYECLVHAIADKIRRVSRHQGNWLSKEQDVKDNLITGFTSGYYTYFRKIFNDLNLHRIEINDLPYKCANFYFIREYCYGSMFRFNIRGEFNIPYGGISYNKKNLGIKINNIFSGAVASVFENTKLHCMDFQEFMEHCAIDENDFIFLDPPYDTDFSNYDGKIFSRYDQERLANVLKNTRGKFILIIKYTDFIHDLYCNDFNTLIFDNQYTYNVRRRNDRFAEHLIITNLPV